MNSITLQQGALSPIYTYPKTLVVTTLKKTLSVVGEVFNQILRAVSKAIGFALVGVVASVISPPLMNPLFFIAGSIFVSRLTLKAYEAYDFDKVKDARRSACMSLNRFKQWQIVYALFFITLSFTWNSLACVSGIVYGGVSALTSDTFQRMQRLKNPNTNQS